MKEHTNDEVLEMLSKRGLPHVRREDYKPEKPTAPYPEYKENDDKMIIEGEAIGKSQRGRGGLPRRLQPAQAAAEGGRKDRPP